VRTLPREPWRGGQICGWQIAYGLPWSVFCGEFKKPGSPLCDEHDHEMREEYGGLLPGFAPGNALGLHLTSCSQAWLVRDQYDELVAGSNSRKELEDSYGFTLSWETEDPDKPEPATEEEIKAWEESGS
jgi:hypothetical protein